MTRLPKRTSASPIVVAAVAIAAASLLVGCAPIVVGAAVVGGAMVVTDRRSSGAQVDDEVIEVKANGRIGEALPGDNVRVNTTSYNRMVLLTGEVPNEGDKATVEQVVARIDNVVSVVNELTVGPRIRSTRKPRRRSSPPRSRPAWSTPRTCSRTRSRS